VDELGYILRMIFLTELPPSRAISCNFWPPASSGIKEAESNVKRTASAEWRGDLKTGKGTVSTASGVLEKSQYSFSTRFENGKGTNPEELLAAAHAGCFTMALSAQLGAANLVAESLETTCSISLEKVGDGFAITESHLELKAKVPGASQAAFDQAVANAKSGCPVSKLYNTKITLNATLEA
jgi:lipoyl-dependent peroxiredoxin